MLMCGRGLCSVAQAQVFQEIVLTAATLQQKPNAFGFSGLPHYAAEALDWRFHAGDSVVWANPIYAADSAWQKASPSVITNDAKRSQELARTRIGWFRLWFRVDSSLDKRGFGFVMSLFGAAEVYVDGLLVARYGIPSASRDKEVIPGVSRFTLQPTFLCLSSDKPHLLAVRYSFAHYDEYVAKLYQGGLISLPTGLQTAFMTWEAVEAYRQTALQTVIQFGVAIGMPLLAALLHLVLFLVYREERANLFVSLFSFFSALQACSFALSSHMMGQSLSGYAIGGIGQTIALPGIGVSLWYVAQALFRTQLPKYHWWITGSNVLAWVMVLFVGDAPTSLQFGVELTAVIVAFVPLLLLIPILISAIRKGLDGAYIMGLGMIVCVIAWIMEVVMLSSGLLYAARPLPIAIFIRFGVYIAIPLALAILLAWRTARLARGLAEQNELLEVNVTKRTQALSEVNTALQLQNHQLEELSLEKQEIVDIVSHDLKNPISAIRGLAELLDTDGLEQQQTQLIIGQIIDTSDRMLYLVKNLLDVNRLEQGGMQFKIVAFDVAPMIESAVWQYQSAATAKDIVLHLSNTITKSTIYADEQAVMQVLDNLISNAVKYSPHGKNVFVRVKSSSSSLVLGRELSLIHI